MYSTLSLRLIAHRGIQRSRNVFIIINFILDNTGKTDAVQCNPKCECITALFKVIKTQ